MAQTQAHANENENRFEVLMSDTDSEVDVLDDAIAVFGDDDDDNNNDCGNVGVLSEENKHVIPSIYVVGGLESIHLPPDSVFRPYNSHGMNANFIGMCFRCNYANHSQKYCPTTRCSSCRKYGHVSSVCFDGIDLTYNLQTMRGVNRRDMPAADR